jgi:hypothetical protein
MGGGRSCGALYWPGNRPTPRHQVGRAVPWRAGWELKRSAAPTEGSRVCMSRCPRYCMWLLHGVAAATAPTAASAAGAAAATTTATTPTAGGTAATKPHAASGSADEAPIEPEHQRERTTPLSWGSSKSGVFSRLLITQEDNSFRMVQNGSEWFPVDPA